MENMEYVCVICNASNNSVTLLKLSCQHIYCDRCIITLGKKLREKYIFIHSKNKNTTK